MLRSAEASHNDALHRDDVSNCINFCLHASDKQQSSCEYTRSLALVGSDVFVMNTTDSSPYLSQ